MLWLAEQRPFQAWLALVLVCLMGLFYLNFPFFHHMYLWFFRQSYVTVPENVSVYDVIRGYMNLEPDVLRYYPSSCRPQNDLAFIPCSQCSDEIVHMLFRRYGYPSNVSVILPSTNRTRVGRSSRTRISDFCPPSRGSKLPEYVVFNSTLIRSRLKPDTVVFAMIRHPLDMFVSPFQYFHTMQNINLTVEDSISTVQYYLRNTHTCDTLLKNHTSSPVLSVIPSSLCVTKHFLSRCLGVPLGFSLHPEDNSTDLEAIKRYIRNIDTKFLLIMIREYLDESLVLLKRYMCWRFKDILYLNNNEQNSSNLMSMLTTEDREVYRKWNAIDHVLYDHFNRTFWNKVYLQGQDFWQDLRFFQYLQREVKWFCENVTPYGDSYIQFSETQLSPALSISSHDCKQMDGPVLDILKDRPIQRKSHPAR